MHLLSLLFKQLIETSVPVILSEKSRFDINKKVSRLENILLK